MYRISSTNFTFQRIGAFKCTNPNIDRGMVVGSIISDISPVKPSNTSPRMTIGDRLNITVTLDQRNQVRYH